MRYLGAILIGPLIAYAVLLSPYRAAYYQDRSEGQQADDIRWIKESTKRYAPVSWYLLEKYDKLPEHFEVQTNDGSRVTTRKSAGTFEYLQGRTRRELLISMETNVHEIAHGYFNLNVFRYIPDNNLLLDWDMVQGYIFLSPTDSYFISCPKKSLFPSAELKQVIPAELRTFRFDDYIGGNTSTQGQGVIGLLDELHAYYLGSKYCYDMFEAYIEAEGSDEAGLYNWVSCTQSTMTAFWEFDFFIKEYLLYMKDRYESDYKIMTDCRLFREAYMAVRKAYSDLIVQYEERIRTEVKLLNSSGKAEASIEDGILWVTPRGSMYRQGTPLFSEAREMLSPVLQSRRYIAIESDFR